MPADDRNRPLLGAWVAAPAVGAIAYLSCYGYQPYYSVAAGGAAGVYNDFIFINLYWIAVVLAMVLGWCFVRCARACVGGVLSCFFFFWGGGAGGHRVGPDRLCVFKRQHSAVSACS